MSDNDKFHAILPVLLFLITLIAIVAGVLGYFARRMFRLALNNEIMQAKAEAKQSAEALQAMRERCRELNVHAYSELSLILRAYPLDQILNHARDIKDRSDTAFLLWYLYNGETSRWVQQFALSITNVLIHKLDVLTTGHLTTWRTEASAAMLYLHQIDSKGRMGEIGNPRHFEDRELPELHRLLGGMSWIIDRTKTGNCPFEFGPGIIEELEALIERVKKTPEPRD